MEKLEGKKVFVGMSGGVDSSVAAYLLKEQGYDVTGVFIRSFNIDGCAERDAEDARRVAEHLGIPFYTFDFEKEYKKEVVEYMVDGYRRGLTPNPDVMCNREIKFGMFLKKALEMGADYIATGHYVRKREMSGTPQKCALRAARPSLTHFCRHAEHFYSSLYEAKDKNKDQSYFLWTLTQDQLKYCLFPVGDYVKPGVRKIARKASLPTAEKKDSQGICFLGQVSLDEFLKDYIKPKKGPIIDANGNKIGEHDGVFYYTIGQRHGIGAGGGGEAYYVAEKDLKNNTLIVARGSNNPALYKKEIEITDVHFTQPMTNNQLPMTIYARVRYRQPLFKATLQMSLVNSHKLIFNKPVKFVAPGQSVVFYETGFIAGLRGRKMLGGGILK